MNESLIETVEKLLHQRDKVMNDVVVRIRRIQLLVHQFANQVMKKVIFHDKSKFESPEFDYFVRATSQLKRLKYGSEEYKKSLSDIKPALDHHYSVNNHHPEYFKNGVNDMSLLQIVEMLADWKAATERHNDGNLKTSIEINCKRFNINDQLKSLLLNTAKQMNWLGEN